MGYEIIKLYTEKLDISSFKNNIEDEHIESVAKFNTSIIPAKDEKISTFIMEYSLRGTNKPISLNWIGICLLNIENSDEPLTEEILLDDDNIKNFITDAIDNFSFFLGGKLPNVYDAMKRKK